MANDTLAIELVVDDQQATVKLDAFGQKIKLVNDDINKVGGDKKFAEKVSTDLTELSRRAAAVHKSFSDVAKTRLDGGQIGAFTKEIVGASQRSRQLSLDIVNIRKELANPNRSSSIAFLTQELKGAETELDKLNRKLQTVRQTQATNRNRVNAVNEFGSGAAGATGLPIGAAAAGAAAVGAALIFGKQAVDASREATNAQRILQATTKETGISFDKLSQSAEKFGELTLQSNAKAQASYAQIVTFANAAGRTEKLDEFRTKFADLAAAKGIDPKNLGEIAKQLNALTDEATDKLLNANPSAFYDKFARSINTTAEKLTDAQKRAAVFDEVLRRGAIFTGEAERRFNSSASALDKLNVKFENAKKGAGAALLPIIEFTNSAVDALKEGKTDNAVALAVRKQTSGLKNLVPFALPVRFAVNTVDKLSRGISDIITGNRLEYETKVSVQFAVDVAKQKEAVDFLRKTDAEIKDAQKNPFGSLQNFALSKVNLANGFFDATTRKKAIEEATADAQRFVDDLQKKFENPALGGNVGLLKLAQKDFRQYSNLFDSEARFKIQQSLASAISEGSARGFQLLLGNQTATLPQLRQNLKQIFASNDLLPDTKSGLINQFESKIKQSVDEGKAKAKELGKAYNDVFDSLFQKSGTNNPFVSVFSEGDKALALLRENLRGLPPEISAVAASMQQKLNDNALFGARLDNKLSVFDLKQEAAQFRNYAPKPDTETDKKRFDEQIKSAVEGSFVDSRFGGSYNNGKKTADYSPEQQRSIFELQVLGGSDKNNLAGTISYLARLRQSPKAVDENLSLQERLQKQLDIVNSSNPKSDDERSLADRKIIALTSGLRPEQLNASQRAGAAEVRERDAVREADRERVAGERHAEALAVSKRIAANQEKLLEVAKEQGLRGIENIVRLVDERDGGKSELKKAPNASDVRRAAQKESDNSYRGGTFFEMAGN